MSRLLILRDFQLCFLSDTIQTGLYENGHDIYEYPVLSSIRGKEDRGYLLPDGSLGLTGCPGYLKRNPLPEYSHTKEEIRDLISQNGFDLIVMLSTREHSLSALNELYPLVQSRKNIPLVLCDGEDYDGIDLSLLTEQIKPRVFFKREIKKHATLLEYSQQLKTPVFPCPFASFTRAYDPMIDDQEKEWDLFLSLGYTYPSRSTLVEKFLEFSNSSPATSPDRCYISTNGDPPVMKSQYGNQIRDLLPWSEYINHQARSKISACMRGYGGDTLHCWEGFSFATAILYCPTNNYIPHEFRNMKHCIYFQEDCSTVQQQLEMILKEDELRKQIAEAGKAHLYTYHTTQKRAEYVTTATQGVLGGRKLEDIYREYEL